MRRTLPIIVAGGGVEAHLHRSVLSHLCLRSVTTLVLWYLELTFLRFVTTLALWYLKLVLCATGFLLTSYI